VRAEILWDSWSYAGWTDDSITAFPALTCLAATFNPQLSFEYGFSIGEEARYRHKDVLHSGTVCRTPLLSYRRSKPIKRNTWPEM
jgi:beta-glucosidase